MLENPEFSHHKKLCIRLKRAEKKVLQIALKHATAIRSKIKDSSQKHVSDCDQDTSRHNAESSTEEKHKQHDGCNNVRCGSTLCEVTDKKSQ